MVSKRVSHGENLIQSDGEKTVKGSLEVIFKKMCKISLTLILLLQVEKFRNCDFAHFLWKIPFKRKCREIFFKFLRPSQNIWTLCTLLAGIFAILVFLQTKKENNFIFRHILNFYDTLYFARYSMPAEVEFLLLHIVNGFLIIYHLPYCLIFMLFFCKNKTK